MSGTQRKTLHVVNWYPNPLDVIEGQFIKDQIDALNVYMPCDVVMLQVRYGPVKIVTGTPSSRERILILQAPIKSWFVKEILSSILLCFVLFTRYDLSAYRLVNFHIAYPLLTYFRFFRNRIKIPVVITEHWSAYHFNFGVSGKLVRVKRIFSKDIPLITVSAALAKDIIRFSGQKLLHYQVRNVVNQTLFSPVPKVGGETRFFMLGCWQYPKVPGIVLDALRVMNEQGHIFKVRIGGYGPYENDLREKIKTFGMSNYADFVGKLSFQEVSREMQQASCFLHASNYETFSLVCAEALSCGTPVVASAVGGIPEYLHPGNGVLVPDNNIDSWVTAIKQFLIYTFDRSLIAREATTLFSREIIGERYQHILGEVIERYEQQRV